MRFITEFSVPETHKELIKDSVITYNKTIQVQLLGDRIEEAFGWNNLSNDTGVHYKLEIEAFPMEKWVEFKKELLNAPIEDIPDHFREKLISLLSELEQSK